MRNPCYKLWQTACDGRLLDIGWDSRRQDESRIDFIRRVRRSVGLDKYTSPKNETIRLEPYGIADQQLTFHK